MVKSIPLTEKEKGVRQHLVDKYNKARSPEAKKKRYEELMENETKLLAEGKNG